jgi:hypothetical protein
MLKGLFFACNFPAAASFAGWLLVGGLALGGIG